MYIVFTYILYRSLRLELLSQLGHLLEQISNKSHIRNLENGRIGVLVDCSNDLAILHTSQMLNGTRNTSAQVKLGSDVLARLANLQTVVRKTAVDGRARSSNGGTERIGQRWHQSVEFLLGLETSATGHDLASCGQIWAV